MALKHRTDISVICDIDTLRSQPIKVENRMSTAIVSIYTPEGFLIAADGYNDGDNRAQKVFQINTSTQGYAFSFAISKWEGVTDGETGLDISCSSVANIVASSLDPTRFHSVQDYVEAFSSKTGQGVLDAIKVARDTDLLSSKDYCEIVGVRRFTNVHFNGFWQGRPFMLSWTICFHMLSFSIHENYCHEELTERRFKFLGSDRILNFLASASNSDDYLEGLRTPGLMAVLSGTTTSLGQAVEAAKSYIEACMHPDSVMHDEACSYIKGRIHMATISPLHGFVWHPDYPV
jgi:hypothetical protein